MKISSTLPAAPVLPVERVSRTVGDGESPRSGGGVQVEFSSVLSRMRADAARHPYGEVRADVVRQAREDIAAGRLGSDADIERAVDVLLQEL